MEKFKKGAASFYIVAFSTLILMIVAISFAAVIISEVERTSNDDLSQSAYDSALAGVEDAKLAYYNYQNCLAQEGIVPSEPNNDGNVSCGEMLWYMNQAKTAEEEDCKVVWKILGKSDSDGNMVEGNIVEVKGDATNNNMQQATTCVTMTDELSDYRGTLSASNMVDVIKLSFADGIKANDIGSMSLKWFSEEDANKANTLSYKTPSTAFPALSIPVAAPPVVSLTVLQTGPEFTMDSFNQVNGSQTNRGTLYFIPTKSESDTISGNALAKSNDKTKQNNPYRVDCADRASDIEGFACSVTINLPEPIGGTRSDETFEVIVSMPYGQPVTEFLLQFYCKDGSECGSESIGSDSGASVAKIKGVQLEVDSTGRANDLYRRVMMRLKSKNDLALTVMGPLELLDADDGSGSAGLTKSLTVTEEYNF